uniref:Large ribosomal subunit protein uL2c n=1 Tax=Euglenaformis proxima TaxID=299110 RepID=A0A023HHN7_9EUGL|nr:ribosomal protein L2 [Euglenaformis proxima]AGL12002.1 ribosomal protein L2 [Euglenaformis proxima]
MIRFYKPYTSGLRTRSISDFFDITKSQPEKTLTCFFQRSKGRNNQGIITSRNRGGGHKRLYRKIDFKRDKLGVLAKVISVEYDPNRNSRISLLHYQDGEKRYILQPRDLLIGEMIVSDFNAPIKVGNCLPLNKIPLGIQIHNIKFNPTKSGQIARSAGCCAQIVARDGNFVSVRLPSGEIRLIKKYCWATIGQVGNVEVINLKFGKAGVMRWLGRTPRVRGVAMNPCDHPHGGGEGKSPIGRKSPVTPWGKPALGQKTRSSKRYSKNYILRSRKA